MIVTEIYPKTALGNQLWFMVVLGLIFAFFGAWGTLAKLGSDWDTFGVPFSCHSISAMSFSEDGLPPEVVGGAGLGGGLRFL